MNEMEYYYIDRQGNTCGPVSETQIPLLGITCETWMWHEGLASWYRANHIDGIKEMFIGVPYKAYYVDPNGHPYEPDHRVLPNGRADADFKSASSDNGGRVFAAILSVLAIFLFRLAFHSCAH